MSTSVLKALPGKLDIKRHSPSILYILASLAMSTSVLKALLGKLDIKRHSPSILFLLHHVLQWLWTAQLTTRAVDGTQTLMNSLPTGYFCMFFICHLFFFIINFCEKLFQGYHLRFKQIGFRSGPTFWVRTDSTSYQQMTLVGK